MAIPYPCYPITKPKDAFVAIGDQKIKLPKPKWVVKSYGKMINCSYHISDNPRSTIIRLMAETHWSTPIEVWLDHADIGTRWTMKDLDERPDLPLTVNWSSGGVNSGYTTSNIADVMASLWKVASEITGRLRRGVMMESVCRIGTVK